jgi:dipeptidyl aminopeptidase/acylaminoacyl peptidase
MKTEKIEFKNSKGMRIVGELQIPEEKGPFPAVIVCHGFKGSKHQEHMVRIANDLTNEGFVTLRFDFTNNPGESDGSLFDITVTQELDDLNKAIDFVKNLEYVNENIGITGHSLGGMVCLLAASEREDVKCYVDLSGVTEFDKTLKFKERDRELKEKGYFEAKSNVWKSDLKVGKQFHEDAMKYDTISAAKKIKIPTLIIHGDKDESVPLEQSKLLFKILNCEKDLKIIKNAPHTYRKDPYLAEVSKETVNWFKRYLK